MKTGVDLIKEEREKVLKDKGVKFDIMWNKHYELSIAARMILAPELNVSKELFKRTMEVCNISLTNWDKKHLAEMFSKPYKERLVIAGQFIAAELDRLNTIEEEENKNK